MFTLGLRASSHGKDRWRIHAVILDPAATSSAEVFSHACDAGGNTAVRGKELAHWLDALLLAHPQVERALLFEQDYSGRGGLTSGTRTRMRLEGAALAAVSQRVQLVEVRDGRGLGSLIGGGKAGALARGEALGLGIDYDEAATAALAAGAL
jgi:hypothetical protein